MSFQYGQLCCVLIREHFGKGLEEICQVLLWGPQTLSLIRSSTKLPSVLIKRGLAVLIQYGFVSFSPSRNPKVADYTLLPDKIILLLRYPSYLCRVREKYGEGAKLLLDEVLRHGQIAASKAVLLAWKRIQRGEVQSSDTLAGIRDAFNQLIVNQYLVCSASPAYRELTDSVPVVRIDEVELHAPPQLDLLSLQKLEAGENVDPPDAGWYWKCNFDRFHQDSRDQVMTEAIQRRFDNNFALVMEGILKKMYLRTEAWSPQSNPVPILEVREEVEKTNPQITPYIEQYIKLLEEDSLAFIFRSGEGSTGSAVVNFIEAFRNLASASIDSIIEHRFGWRALRIFRLVRIKKFVDQEQLQKLALIPDKEAKQLTYKLLEENFLHLHELRKSSGAGPNKNFYLFYVNFNQVVKAVLEMCYKAILNTITRADHEKKENFRLIEKFTKLNAIADNMRAQGDDADYIKQMMDEWMTPPERNMLESVESLIKKLRLAELKLDETIFLLQLYSFYDAEHLKEKTKTKTKAK